MLRATISGDEMAVAHHHMMLRGGHLVARHRVIQIGQVLLSEALAVHQGGIGAGKRHRRRSHGRIPVALGTVPISGSTAQWVSKRMTPRQGNPGRGGMERRFRPVFIARVAR